MSSGTAQPYKTAYGAANSLLKLLEPYCERIEIAGSIRRGKRFCRDIEIVAVPKLTDAEGGLFGESNRLWAHCDRLVRDGQLSRSLPSGDRAKDGPKYKQFGFGDFQVDLFTAERDNWGLQLMIRTGPWEYSRRMVTPRNKGGRILPTGFQVRDAHLWDGDVLVPVGEERTLFELMGRTYTAPEDRT